jgi:hypothetical protein
LLVALALLAERLRGARFATLMPVALLVPVAMAATLWFRAGVYENPGAFSRADVNAVRKLGREAVKLIARTNADASVELIYYDSIELAGVLMRYEIWTSAPSRIRDLKMEPADTEAELVARMRAAVQRGWHAIAEVGVDCAVHAEGVHVSLLESGKDAAVCRSITAQLREQPLGTPAVRRLPSDISSGAAP